MEFRQRLRRDQCGNTKSRRVRPSDICGLGRELATEVLFHIQDFRENKEPADQVLELPDVAGPLILKEEFLEPRRDLGDGRARFGVLS